MFKSKKQGINKSRTDTLIGEGTVLEGTIKCEAGIRIEGQIMGEVICQGDVVVGEKGTAHSHLTAREVIIAGVVRGNVYCTGRLTITSTGQLYGNTNAPSFVIDQGGVFRGTSMMADEDVSEPRKSAEEPQTEKQQTEAAPSGETADMPADPAPQPEQQLGQPSQTDLVLSGSEAAEPADGQLPAAESVLPEEPEPIQAVAEPALSAAPFAAPIHSGEVTAAEKTALLGEQSPSVPAFAPAGMETMTTTQAAFQPAAPAAVPEPLPDHPAVQPAARPNAPQTAGNGDKGPGEEAAGEQTSSYKGPIAIL